MFKKKSNKFEVLPIILKNSEFYKLNSQIIYKYIEKTLDFFQSDEIIRNT